MFGNVTLNFNFYNQPEYDLNKSLISEMISLYGIQIKFAKVTKINRDKNVFKDYQHLIVDEKNVFEMFALPENSEGFDSSGYQFNGFGFGDFNNVNFFIAVDSFKDIQFKEIVGNLIVLPSNKILEITDVTFQVPGINNDFVNNNTRSVYRLTCTPYEFKLTDNLSALQKKEPETIEPLKHDAKSLDDYFDELMKDKNNLKTELEVVDSQIKSEETNVIDEMNRPIDKKVKTAKVVTTDDVWGSFS